MDVSQEQMLSIMFAFLMLCAGTILVIVLYLWLAWYANYLTTQNSRRLATATGAKPHKGPGLSRSEFLLLPRFFFKTVEGSNVVDGLECPVCLDQFCEGDECLRIPACQHCFHVICAESWLSRQSLCPICRGSARAPGPAATVSGQQWRPALQAQGDASVSLPHVAVNVSES